MSDRPPAPTIIAGRYLLKEKLGPGTIGTTWLAEDRVRDQEIIIKILHPDLVQECRGLSGVAEKLRLTTSFRHPSVVSVFDFAKAEDLIYLSMERLNGETLRHRLVAIREGNSPPFNLFEIADLIATITEVLEEGSKLGLPHGGIKPENVHLTEGHLPRLSEFGINTLASTAALTSSATLLQARHYLAPELYENHHSLSAATDQFALGILWQELLATLPIKARTVEFRRQHSLAARLTQPEAQLRFPSIADLAKALTELPSSRRLIKGSRPSFPRSVVSRFSKAVALIATVLFGYFLGSGLNSPPKANLKLLPTRSAMKQRIRELDQRRMQSLTRALIQPEMREAFLEHFRTTDSFEIIEAFYEVDSLPNDTASQVTFSNLIATLEQKISDGEESLRLYEQLEQRRRQLSDIDAESLPFIQESFQSLDSKRHATIELLGQGRFQRANTLMASALQEFNQTYETEQARLLSKLESSRQRWQRALAERNTPYAEPNRNLAGNLESLLNKAPHAIDTLTGIARITETYQHWESDWQQMPSPTPDQFQNSLGMVFQSIDQLQVSIFETRIIDFYHFVASTGFDENRSWRDEAISLSPSHPVNSISRYGATRFCDWLTVRERSLGVIPSDKAYRLPTDQEWSRFAGLIDEEGHWPRERHLNRPPHYPWTTPPRQYSNAGNYYTPSSDHEANNFHGHRDRYDKPSPVGMFPPSPFGLYDLGGNIMEWVSTPYTQLPEKTTERNYTLRGAGWRTINPEQMQTGYRLQVPGAQLESGFRCVLAPTEVTEP